MVAASVWAAAGLVTPAADVASTRLVVPGSVVWPLAAFVVAMAVPAWRRSPILAAPSLLALAPWLPLPIPPVFLIWTGPLAWAPLGLAVIAVLVAGRGGTRAQTPPPDPVGAGRHATAAGLATLLAGGLVLQHVGGRLPGGDEPHYLIIAQSLLNDGDLRIENNHASRDYAAYWPGTLAPHAVQPGQDGAIYSIHAPGVAVLVAPLFALFGLTGAQFTILAVSALGGALVWLAGWYASRRRDAAWFAWAAVSGSVTMLVQSVMIFPDGPGAAIVAAAAVVWLRLLTGLPVSTRALVGLSGLLAALPFLHTRFVVLAAGLGLALAHRIWVADDAPKRLRRLGAFFALPAVGAVCWFGYFYLLYGTPDPTSPYGANRESSLTYVPGGVLGLLFDQQSGLLAYSPVLALAAVGWWWRRQADAVRGGPLAVVAVCYLAGVATYWMWWAGVPATPARLATAVLPLLAAPLAVVWRLGGVAVRTVAASLLGASIAISALVLGTQQGGLAWSVRDAQAPWLWAIGPVVDLPRAWPSFFWRLVGGDVSSEWPFVAHVAAWAGGVALVAAATRAVVRAGDAGRLPVVGVTSLALPLALMLVAQAGWWLNGVSGLRPAPAQMAVARASAEGASTFAVSPATVSRVPSTTLPLRITIPRTDLPVGNAVVWAALTGVPAGQYELHLAAPRPVTGTVTIRPGFTRDPMHVVSLEGRSVHTSLIDLPVGVSDLRFLPDDALASGNSTLVLVPRTLSTGPFVPARARLTVEGADVYVLEGAPFVEGDALWVRGEGTAGLVLVARGQPRTAITLRLRNGASPNPVDVSVGREAQRLELAPSASADIPIWIDGTVTVRVVSPSGFRPSDDGESHDGRYLGVRVEFGGAPGDAPPADQ